MEIYNVINEKFGILIFGFITLIIFLLGLAFVRISKSDVNKRHGYLLILISFVFAYFTVYVSYSEYRDITSEKEQHELMEVRGKIGSISYESIIIDNVEYKIFRSYLRKIDGIEVGDSVVGLGNHNKFLINLRKLP